MVASSKLTLDIKPIEAMQKGIDKVEKLVFDIAEDVIKRTSDTHLPIIRQYPPRPAVLPFTFANERSRRWYFANKVPRGSRGGRYQRSGKFGQSWTVKTMRGNGLFTAELSSSFNAALFVVGNLAGQRQVAGHRITGWKLVNDRIS